MTGQDPRQLQVIWDEEAGRRRTVRRLRQLAIGEAIALPAYVIGLAALLGIFLPIAGELLAR